MAKTKFNEEEDVQKVETPNEVNKETATVSETSRAAEEVKITTGSKKVKIHVTENAKFLVACVPYDLKKDKDYLVPSDVAAILCNAKKAYRI